MRDYHRPRDNFGRMREEPGTTDIEPVLLAGEPVIRSIVARRLGGSSDAAQDIDDVCSDALLALLERADSPGAEALQNPAAYAAVVAYHACDEYYRKRFPQRHKVKNRLRYLLKPERGYDLWQDAAHGWLCGRTSWRGRGPVAAPRDAGPQAVRMAPERLLGQIFQMAGGPIGLDALVDLTAAAWGMTDRMVPLDQAATLAQAPAADSLEHHLPRLWSEICTLPQGQRAALLFNLRGERGESTIALLPATGAASMEQIAEVLGIGWAEFLSLWNRLPLGDQEIGERLGIARQQVINLRVSARKRLRRRLREVIGEIL